MLIATQQQRTFFIDDSQWDRGKWVFIHLTRALGLLKLYVADGQITSLTFGCCVLDQNQGVNLLHPQARAVPHCAL